MGRYRFIFCCELLGRDCGWKLSLGSPTDPGHQDCLGGLVPGRGRDGQSYVLVLGVEVRRGEVWPQCSGPGSREFKPQVTQGLE